MLVDISPNEAYKIIKDCDVAKGWKQYAIEELFTYLSKRNPEQCIDIVGELIEWSHYKSTKELLNNYQFNNEVIEKTVPFRVWADLNDPEAGEDGYKLEYLVPPC